MTTKKIAKIARRFKWQREDEPQNALAYLFLLQNLIYGITYMFFSNSAALASSQFTAAFFSLPVWGFMFTTLFVVAILGIVTRNKWIGSSVGFLGVGVWGYGFVLYLLEGVFFSAFVIYFTQIMFWSFWHLGIQRHWAKQERLAKLKASKSVS